VKARLVVLSFLVSVAVGSVVIPFEVGGQTPRQIPRIGALLTGSPPVLKTELEAFRQGLRELGYREGENIAIDYRWVEEATQFRKSAEELIRANVHVMVTQGTTATTAAKHATSTVPIVFLGVGDPVGTGIVGALARPGGNATGQTNLSAELSAKLLELLKEVVPGLMRVGVLRNPINPVSAPQLRWTETAARSLGLQLEVVDVRDPKELDAAIAAMKKAHAGAFTVLADPMLLSQRRRIASLALEHRLPATFNRRHYAEEGGLIAYGPNLTDEWRRTAALVDKVLKGAKPADMPVEQPTKVELVINLKTAKALGLTVPPPLLVRANQLIE
jgi:putative ABC transport system substrate-binding protein